MENILLDFISLDLIFAEGTGGSGKRPMALNSSIDTGNLKTTKVKHKYQLKIICYKISKLNLNLNNIPYLLESIDVLGVVPQQFPVLLDCPDEFMTWRRLELTRIDLSGELEKGPGILAEVIDVEHGLKDKEEMIFM